MRQTSEEKKGLGAAGEVGGYREGNVLTKAPWKDMELAVVPKTWCLSQSKDTEEKGGLQEQG